MEPLGLKTSLSSHIFLQWSITAGYPPLKRFKWKLKSETGYLDVFWIWIFQYFAGTWCQKKFLSDLSAEVDCKKVRRWQRQADLSTVGKSELWLGATVHDTSCRNSIPVTNGTILDNIYIYKKNIYKQLSEVKQQRAGIRRCNVESTWSKEEETPGSSVVFCFYTLMFHSSTFGFRQTKKRITLFGRTKWHAGKEIQTQLVTK